jgi:squalene-hopene/tetraprenyl-beta-curcumene cyclase
MRQLMRTGAFLLAALAAAGGSAAAPADAGPSPDEVRAVVDKAAAFLKSRQAADGSFSAKFSGPGVTALVAAALLRNGYPPDDPVVARALGYLEKSVKKDGGIYDRRLANYTTSVAVMALKEANVGGRYDTVIKNAADFLKGLQYGDTRADPKDATYGGVGYDGNTRPDLSNTQFFIEAMVAAGVPKDDPAMRRALQFVSRCQNLPGETNDQPFARKATEDDKGGLVYRPDPEDKEHVTAAGGLRSLGAMTYGGLKSFLYAGVSHDDPRVKGAVRWIRGHYTLEENPGLGQAGLFYYYHTFGKAMAALGQDRFEDARGVKHDWRRELFQALRKRQREDGSFVNAGDKTFGEADPSLATAFALLTLSYVRESAK